MHWPHPTTWNWEFINTFAPWVAAAVTFAAVLLSLRLAGDRTSLRVAADFQHRSSVSSSSGDEYTIISIVNRRAQPAYVRSLYWVVGPPWRRRRLAQEVEVLYGVKGPFERIDGFEPVEFGLGLGDVFNDVLQPNSNAILRGPRFLRHIKIGVRSSTGKTFEARVSRELQQKIIGYLMETNT